jgi:dihydroorotate dehydrogenase (fumarate)
MPLTATLADIELAGIKLEHPLMNAAGTCLYPSGVDRFAHSAVSAITLGSITVRQREQSPGRGYWSDPLYSLSSLGLPNRGHEYFRGALPGMASVAHEAGKPLLVSVAGFEPGEYAQLARLVEDVGADGVELNLGCPIARDAGTPARIASFDPGAIVTIVEEVRAVVAAGYPLGVKLSPYSDPWLLGEVARRLSKLPINYVVMSNSFPNAFSENMGKRHWLYIGLAGMSGAALKPIGLGQVWQLREALPDSIQIVGAGGVSTGRDVIDYLQAGACAVQAATMYWNAEHDVGVFEDVLRDIPDDNPDVIETDT